MSVQLIFDSSVEGLVRAVRDQLSPKTIQSLASEGLDIHKRLLPAYPVASWVRYVQIICADLFPDVEADEAMRRLASLTVDAYSEGLIGSAMFGLVKLLGPDRTIGRMTRNFKTGCNFVETRSNRVGRGRYEIWLNDVSGVPGFYLGLLEAGMLRVGAKDLSTRILRTDGRECTIAVEWADGAGPD